MQIVTSSFFTKLPPQIARVSIARWAPQGHRELPTLRALCPGEWFKAVDVDEYRKRYLELLDTLDARSIVRQVEDLAGGAPAALLCWERPRDGRFCHRAYVSAWLYDQLGLDVYEFGLEAEGCGHRHPKLPAEHRAGPAQGQLL